MSERSFVRVTERARVIRCGRRGITFEWDLHGGSVFRRETFSPSDIFAASHGGPLIVDEVAAGARGIYSGHRVRVPA